MKHEVQDGFQSQECEQSLWEMGQMFFHFLQNDPFAIHWYYDSDGNKLLTMLRMSKNHICKNRIRVHLERVYPFMNLSYNFRCGTTFAWISCHMQSGSIKKKKMRRFCFPSLLPIFADPWSKKIISPNFFARSRLTLDLSVFSCTKLQNGHVFTTC